MFRIFISHSYLATFILPSTTRPTSRPCNLNLHKPHLFYGPQTGKSYRTATKYVIYLRKVQSANEIWNFSSLLEPFKLSNPSATGAAPELRWETVAVRREICLKDRLEGTNISLDLGLLQCPRLQHSNLIKIHKTKPDLLPRVLVPVARSARSRDWIIWPQYINVWGMIVKNVTKLNGFYKCPEKWRR